MDERYVRVNASSLILRKRRDLLDATIAGITDVMELEGRDPKLILPGSEKQARLLSEIDKHASQRQSEVDPNSSSTHCFTQFKVNSYAAYLAHYAKSVLSPNIQDYVLTNKDFYTDGEKFTFGMTLVPEQLSIQSIARVILGIRGYDAQDIMTRQIARHEFGYLSGINVQKELPSLVKSIDKPSLEVYDNYLKSTAHRSKRLFR